MTLNIKIGSADALDIVRIVQERAIDLLSVQELTPSALQKFKDAGLESLLEYSFTSARRGGAGTGVWSRHPLVAAKTLDGFANACVSAQIPFEGLRSVLTFVAVHASGPLIPGFSLWQSDMERLEALLHAARGPMIIAGDFNSSHDVAQFRRLLSNGFRDAAEQLGVGYLPTFPADRWFPPLLTIDHLLLRLAASVQFTTVSVKGTDHDAIIARVAVS